MPYPYDTATNNAISRLSTSYNISNYNASTNPYGLGQGGHRVNFIPALTDLATVASSVAAAASSASTSAGSASSSASAAAASAAALAGTSTTSVAIGTGSKSFTTQASKSFTVGTWLQIKSAANPTANNMAGQVTAYSGTSLTVNVTKTTGSGTYTDWDITVSAEPGTTGSTGATGATGPTPTIQWNFSNGTTDSDPGNGLFKLSNAAPASATWIYFDNLDRNGNSVTAFLDAMDDSTTTANRGFIVLTQISAQSLIQVFQVTGAVIDGTGYRKVPVTNILSTGSFTNADSISVAFYRTGDKGLDGVGAGDVVGPSSVTDGRPALFDGTTGKLIKQASGALAAVALSGNYSDLTVSGGAIVYAKIQNVSATDKLLGRSTAGAGSIEEISCGAAGRALIGVTGAADKVPYFSGTSTATTTDLTSTGRTIVGSTSLTNARQNLGLAYSTTAGRLARFTDAAGSTGQTAGLFEDGSGNVGFNTTSPYSIVDINGNIQLHTYGQRYYYGSSGTAPDTNWSTSVEATPVGAQVVTAAAYVIRVAAAGVAYGLQLRNTSDVSLFEVDGLNGSAYLHGFLGVRTASPNVSGDFNGAIATRNVSTTLANSRNDNVACPAASYSRITGPTAAFQISGITAGYDGRCLILYNTTSQTASLNNEDTNSTAANRISTGTGGAINFGRALLVYDSTSSRWIVISYS